MCCYLLKVNSKYMRDVSSAPLALNGAYRLPNANYHISTSFQGKNITVTIEIQRARGTNTESSQTYNLKTRNSLIRCLAGASLCFSSLLLTIGYLLAYAEGASIAYDDMQISNQLDNILVIAWFTTGAIFMAASIVVHIALINKVEKNMQRSLLKKQAYKQLHTAVIQALGNGRAGHLRAEPSTCSRFTARAKIKSTAFLLKAKYFLFLMHKCYKLLQAFLKKHKFYVQIIRDYTIFFATSLNVIYRLRNQSYCVGESQDFIQNYYYIRPLSLSCGYADIFLNTPGDTGLIKIKTTSNSNCIPSNLQNRVFYSCPPGYGELINTTSRQSGVLSTYGLVIFFVNSFLVMPLYYFRRRFHKLYKGYLERKLPKKPEKFMDNPRLWLLSTTLNSLLFKLVNIFIIQHTFLLLTLAPFASFEKVAEPSLYEFSASCSNFIMCNLLCNISIIATTSTASGAIISWIVYSLRFKSGRLAAAKFLYLLALTLTGGIAFLGYTVQYLITGFFEQVIMLQIQRLIKPWDQISNTLSNTSQLSVLLFYAIPEVFALYGLIKSCYKQKRPNTTAISREEDDEGDDSDYRLLSRPQP